MNVLCEACGNEFKRRNARQRFCSTGCRDTSMRRTVALICQQCGREFHRPPWEVQRGRTKYCSRACYHEASIGHRGYNTVEPIERICESCGKSFLTGGRGRAKIDQRFCSRSCQQRSRYRHGAKALELQAIDAAYIAGFIDGEGSFILYRRRDVVAFRISAANTVLSVLQWIADVTGVGAVIEQQSRNANHRNSAWWTCNAEAAESVTRQILPYLRIKRAHAELALSVQERLRDPKLKADRTWQQEAITQMQALNKLGSRAADEG